MVLGVLWVCGAAFGIPIVLIRGELGEMMIKNFVLENTSLPLLGKALDVYSLRQKAIASNIANINTVGYQANRVDFEEQLQQQMDKGLSGRTANERHIPLGRKGITEVTPELVRDESETLSSGVNNVDIDQEIVEQVKNEIRYMYATRMARGKFDGLRASIKGHVDR